MPPPVNGILETSLYVEDLERSARFYERLFGFERVLEIDRLIALHVPGRRLLLLFLKGASRDISEAPPHDGEGKLHIAFAIDRDNLDAWRTWLPQQGVEIEQEKEWERGGVSLYFRDPDGHSLEVATPGVWSVY